LKIRNILLAPLRLIDYLFDRIFALVCAMLFAQIPQIIILYIQRLGGHVDELARIIRQYRSSASTSGKDLGAYIDLHLQSSIPEFVSSGKIMTDNLERYGKLSTSFDDLATSTGAEKFFSFIKGLDIDIFKSVMKDFSPGLPLNFEGVIYTGAGLITGILIYIVLKKTLQSLFKKAFGNRKKVVTAPVNPDNFLSGPDNNFKNSR